MSKNILNFLLDKLFDCENYSEIFNILYIAAFMGRLDVVKYLLDKKEIDEDSYHKLYCILRVAIKNNNEIIIDYFYNNIPNIRHMILYFIIVM